MKKQYIAPELDKLIFSVEDIITHSLATSDDGSGGYDGGDWDDLMGALIDDTFNLD